MSRRPLSPLERRIVARARHLAKAVAYVSASPHKNDAKCMLLFFFSFMNALPWITGLDSVIASGVVEIEKV